MFKTAISNHRIVSHENGKVRFRYKDYRHGAKRKIMTLSTPEFIRRFALHILPKGFVRVRHYGILAGRIKRKLFDIPIAIQKKDYQTFWKDRGLDVLQCPHCKKGKLVFLENIPKRGPPHKSSHQNHNGL